MSTQLEPLRIKITGMDCAGCARSIENAVSQIDDVDLCELNFTTETLRVDGAVSQATITNVVRDLGFDVADPTQVDEAESTMPPRNFWHFMWQRTETRLALIAALLILPGLVLTEILGRDYAWVDALSLVAMVMAGWPIARSAWRSITVGREININVLMTVAAIGAVIIGAFVEAAMVMVLFAIGEALEGYTASRARNAIRSLMQVAPSVATRLDGNQQTQVNVSELAIGDTILVRPGDRIPMDGQVLAGYSAVNQAAITGESRLIDKTIDDELFAGSINGEGALELRVTHLAADNTIARMIRLVEEAQERRSPAQRFIDQFAKRYTPAVMLLALLIMAVPPLFFGQPFWNPNAETFGWFYRGLALLVVACPCALVISTPVSIISAISNAAKHGVLIKGGVFLERLSQVQAIAFDKTGTLTRGQPTVLTIRSVNCEENPAELCYACEDVLALAGAVEVRSEHPLAHAVVAATAARGLADRYPPAENVSAMMGRGVGGRVDGRDIFIGSHAYFDANVPHPADLCAHASTAAAEGCTPMMIGTTDLSHTDGSAPSYNYLGTITVADSVRDSSRDVIASLQKMGLRSVAMLTGDATATAQKVADEIGITDIRADLLPEDKVAAVESLQFEFGPLAMVGDGINDAPALATADVGIAIGGAGSSTQAMETADITLMHDDLRQLPFTLDLARATMHTIRTNVIVSIGIKLVFLVMVVMGVGTMWMAVLADVGTSLLVTLNGMRLLRRG